MNRTLGNGKEWISMYTLKVGKQKKSYGGSFDTSFDLTWLGWRLMLICNWNNNNINIIIKCGAMEKSEFPCTPSNLLTQKVL